MRSPRQRARERQAAAGRRLNVSRHLNGPDPFGPAPLPPPLIEHPPIAVTHPTWWQVHRVEIISVEAPPYFVLIGEFPDETTAIRFQLREQWQTRLMKWGDRRPAYFTFRPIRVLPPITTP